jgi:hypothetical protein
MLAASLAVLTTLAACDSVVVYEPLYSQRYSDGMFDYAGRNGEMNLDVIGNPFGSSNFVQIVADDMYGATRGAPVKFTPQPQGPGSAPFHVVMAFNPPPGATSDEACARRVSPTTGTNGVVLVLAAFCSGDVVMTEATGRAGNIAGPDDPRFRSLVRQVALALIPPYDRRNIGVGGQGGTPP